MKKIVISGLIVSFALLIGRISGFVREIFVASAYGASIESDIAIILLSISDILVNLLVGGALGMVFIPEMKKLPEGDAKNLSIQVLCLSGAIFTLFSIILTLFSTDILLFFAPGLNVSILNEVSPYLNISLIAIPLTVMAGVITAYLNSVGKFFIPACGTFIFNFVVITFIVVSYVFYSASFLLLISTGVVVGSLFRLLVFFLKSGLSTNLYSSFNKILITTPMLKQYLFCIASSGFLYIIPVFVRAFSSNSGEGYLSIANYALKLVDFPLAVFLSVFAIISLPKLSSLSAEKNIDDFSSIFTTSFFSIAFISICISVIFMVFPTQLVSLVFEWGKISKVDIVEIANILQIAVISLVFQGLISFLISTHAAKGDNAFAFYVSTCVVIFFSLFCYFTEPSVEYVFYSMNIAYLIIFALLLISLVFRHKISFNVNWLTRMFKVFIVFAISIICLLYLKDVVKSIADAFLMSVFFIFINMFSFLFLERDNLLAIKNEK